MKKALYFVPILFALIGCDFNTSNYQQPSNITSNTKIEETAPHSASPKDAAPEIARTFVKKNFANDCKFEPDVVLENTMVSNRYQVMQRFNSNTFFNCIKWWGGAVGEGAV